MKTRTVIQFDSAIYQTPKGRLKRIAERDGWTCHYCGVAITPYKKIYRSEDCAAFASIDHKIPKERGGTNTDENYVLACMQCNYEKSSLVSYPEFLERKRSAREKMTPQ